MTAMYYLMERPGAYCCQVFKWEDSAADPVGILTSIRTHSLSRAPMGDIRLFSSTSVHLHRQRNRELPEQRRL